MKILHLIYDNINNPWVGGGGAVRAYEIYTRLSSRHSVTLVCGRYPGARDYCEGGIKTYFVGTQKNSYILSTFGYTIGAMSFLRRHAADMDILIEDFAPYNPLFPRLLTNVPVVLQVHHKEGINLFRRYFIFGLPFMLTEQFYPGLFGNTICVSGESKKKFNLDNAVILQNGIDSDLLETFSSDAGYIMYIGRLHIHNKGLDTAMRAMSHIDTKLIIAGRGRDEHKLMTLAEAPEVAGKVEFAGFIDKEKKINLLASSSVLIVPSRYEGQGIVVLEAAACGKPVIVSDIPELRYAVDAGFGISFKTGNPDDLARKIRFLLENNSLRSEMGRKAHEYAKNYTWDKIALDYEQYLLKVVSAKG